MASFIFSTSEVLEVNQMFNLEFLGNFWGSLMQVLSSDGGLVRGEK